MFPGSFDPFTAGHLNILKRALTMFDEVVVAVGVNIDKRGFFPNEKRIDIIRQANPDLLIIPDPDDYMCDHIAASKLAFDAAFMATVPHYITKYPAIDNITPIYYMATAAGINFTPTEYVDITDVYEKKLEMLHCHESQEVWLRDHDGVDYTKECRILSEYYGLHAHVDYAEGFRPCLVAHRIRTERVLP